MKKNYQQFAGICPAPVKQNIKLARFCTMKVGGPADLFVEARTKEELIVVLKLAKKLGIKYFVLAGGSNVIFPDKGWRGLVVRYKADKIEILRHSGEPLALVLRSSESEGRRRLQNRTNQSIRSWTQPSPSQLRPRATTGQELWRADASQDDNSEISGIHSKSVESVVVEAGVMLGNMVRSLIKQGLGGFNFLANIPGSVGGAVVGNVGCYGKEIKDVLREVEIFNVKTGEIITMKPSELGFAYRHSKLKNHPELVVLSGTFDLQKIEKKQALKEIAEEKKLRWGKHPHAPSCGSWFKNPSRSEPAWKFIEAAEMKGVIVGGAKISNKHANFLINYQQAKVMDVIKLSKLVKQRVKAKTGISLTEEVRIIR